jgi:hypothetical protein
MSVNLTVLLLISAGTKVPQEDVLAVVVASC